MILCWLIGAAAAKVVALATRMPIEANQTVKVYGPVHPGFRFDKAICTWNIEAAGSCSLIFESSVDGGPWRPVGRWPGKCDGSVSIGGTAEALRIRIKTSATSRAHLDLLAVSFATVGNAAPSPEEVHHETPKQPPLDIATNHRPGLAGLPFLNAAQDVLAFWSKVLERPGPPIDISKATSAGASSLADACNAAGTFLGFRAYASFFRSIGDLEAGISESLPMVCELRVGETSEAVLIRAFTPRGDVDAWIYTKGDARLGTIPRGIFDEEWARAGRLVMLIQPAMLHSPGQEESKPNPCWLELLKIGEGRYGKIH